MKSLDFTVLAWSAWTPDFNADGLPDVSFIPAMQRRRLSRLSKMSFWTLERCLSDYSKGSEAPHFRTVFASPHGEIHRTQALLTTLAERDPLSPMGFSLSVHNTTAGIYSIVAKNQAPSNSVAAGRDTLEQAMLEAVTQSQFYEQPVLLCYADEPLPEIYQNNFPEKEAGAVGYGIDKPFSISLLITAEDSVDFFEKKEQSEGMFCLESTDLETPEFQCRSNSRLALVDLLEGTQKSCVFSGERRKWAWREK